MSKPLKLIDSKEDCILVYAANTGIYKVIDIEQDVICITKVKEQAYTVFNSYNLEAVRNERKTQFYLWLKQMVDSSASETPLELGE